MKRRVIFYIADKIRERRIANAIFKGVRHHGMTFETRLRRDWTEPQAGVDIACVWGVKSRSREFLEAHWKRGIDTIYFDKGYRRGAVAGDSYVRISANAFQPHDYFQQEPRPPDRFHRWGARLRETRLRAQPGVILIAGSSQKYANFHRLGDVTDYAKKIVRRLAKDQPRRIVYRPKPSWSAAVKIRKADFSGPDESIEKILRRTYCLVTHGSNACLDAVIAGVPAIVLGDGIARPISSTTLDDVLHPREPSIDERYQLLCDVAYCQWLHVELAAGVWVDDLMAVIDR